MNKRRQKSSGQALVLVTVGLLAMAGLMGLAVDMGWSFFVQKQAQSLADAAALAAVQEAMAQIEAHGGPITSLCSSVTPSGVNCSASATPCASASSNLLVGCQYALLNFSGTGNKVYGFDYTTTSSGQNVTMQAGTGTGAQQQLTLNGTTYNGIVYYVTARAVEATPQLFSAVFGHTLGTVSAVATAAIAPSIGPGSFFGMNQAGDCVTDPSSNWYPSCGLDVSTGTGSGGMSCGSTSANLCAPSGIILASSCASSSQTGCSQAYAGAASGPGAWGSSLTVMSSGTVTGSWTPSTATYTTNPSTFQDPTYPNPQPPLQVPTQTSAATALPSCGYPNGQVYGTGPLGPFQYYSYNASTGFPDGNPIQIPNGATFSSSATSCPGAGVDPTLKSAPGLTSGSGTGQSTSFPTYIFWGGASVSDATFGPGQYVMAGTNSATGSVFGVSGTVTGNTATGTMFIFTDNNYPGLWINTPGGAAGSGQIANIQNGATYLAGLSQGTIGPFKNSNITLSGLVNSANSASSLPDAMNAYSGIAWWQDRRNSPDGYNQPSNSTCVTNFACCTSTACTGDDGSVIVCNPGGLTCAAGAPSANTNFMNTRHVTATSPGVVIDPGHGNIALNGVYYQPRGAWIELVHGTTGFSCSGATSPQCPLQVLTGALFEDTGDTGMLLAGPTNPLLTYKARLIQ